MDAKDHAVITVIGDQRRFVVPIFQRQYAWGESRLGPFWEDVVAKAEEVLTAKPKFSHYMGALILAPGGDGFTVGVTPRVQVIDGQQRLTTFQIFLVALRQIAHEMGTQEIEQVIDSYLYINPLPGDKGPDARFRLVPTPEDKATFHLIVASGLQGLRVQHPNWFYQNGRLIKGNAPNAVRALWYLYERITRYANEGVLDDGREHSLLTWAMIRRSLQTSGWMRYCEHF